MAKGPADPDPSAQTSDTVPSGAPAPSVLPPGMQLAGRYTVLNELGRGAMGTVYAVYDAKLNRRVALKVLHSRPGADPDHDPLQTERRLLREAQAIARISHPNVVNVYDVGQLADGQVFLALELVDGETLRHWLSSSPRRWRAILDVLIDAGRGLAAVHAAGLIHRDFKPANVLVGSDGRVRVTDFGVVRPHHAPEVEEPLAAPSLGDDWKTITEAGKVAGTPRYMAPEIFEGRPGDVRSDIYSFCVALYEALYERHPFADNATVPAVSPLELVPTRDVPAPPSSTVPAWVGQAVVAGLRIDPARRPASMDALLQMLARDPHKERLHRLMRVGVAALVLTVMVLGGFVWRALRANRVQLCRGSEDELAGIWDDGARQRVERALLATKQPFAGDTWRNLRRTFDRYAAAWVDMHRESCLATRLKRVQSDAIMTVRTACLDKRRQSLAAVVDVLAHADATVVERAEQAVTGLASLDGCADVPALLAEVPPPEDRATRARVDALRARLARSVPLRLAGKTAEATVIADGALAEVRQLDYAPLLAEALLESARTRLAETAGPAVPLLTEAVWTATAHRDDRVAAAAAVSLVEAYGLLNQPAQWKVWQDFARATLQRIGGDDALEAQLWSALGQCYHEQGRYADVYAAHEKSAQLMRRRFGPRDMRTLEEERNSLIALHNIGREEEARGRKLDLLTRTEEVLGPRHPLVARMLISVGFSDAMLGHLDEGDQLLERAAAILRDLGALESRRWTSWYNAAGGLALLKGRYAVAQAIAERGLKLSERVGMRANTVSLSLMRIAQLARTRLGHGADAIAVLQEELRRAEANMGADNPALESVFLALADCEELMGRAADALAVRERYVGLMRARNADDSGQVAEAQLELDRSLASARPNAVLANGVYHRRVLAASGPFSTVARMVYEVRGEALLALGRERLADDELTAAVRIADAAGYDPNVRAQLRGMLARARYSIDPHAATELVAEAEREYDLAERPDPLARAALRRWAATHRVLATANSR